MYIHATFQMYARLLPHNIKYACVRMYIISGNVRDTNICIYIHIHIGYPK